MSGYHAILLNSFLLSIVLVLCLRGVARAWHLVDVPGGRKRHEGAVPLCGGLAMYIAFVVAGLGADRIVQMPWTFSFGLGLLVLLGMADDRWPLPASTRVIFQIGASAFLVGEIGIANLGALAGEQPWHLAAGPGIALAIFFFVGVMNSVNMLDGLDGLAGGSVAAALFWIALIATHHGSSGLALNAMVLLAAVLGFLVFNMRHRWRAKATVFMGDAGSIMLGAALAYFVVRLSGSNPGVAFPTLLWIVVLPATDTLSLIARRIAAGRSPLSPDRWHLHHLLVDAGVPHGAAAALLVGAGALCGAIGYVGIVLKAPDAVMASSLAVPILAHTALVAYLTSYARHPVMRGVIRRDDAAISGEER